MLSEKAQNQLSKWLQAEKKLLGFSNDELAKHISARSGHSVARDTISRFINKKTQSLGSAKPAFVGYLGFNNAQFEAWLEGQDTNDIGRSNRQILREAIEQADEEDLLSSMELIAKRLRVIRESGSPVLIDTRSSGVRDFNSVSELLQFFIDRYGEEEIFQSMPRYRPRGENPQEDQQRRQRWRDLVEGREQPNNGDIASIAAILSQYPEGTWITPEYVASLVPDHEAGCENHLHQV